MRKRNEFGPYHFICSRICRNQLNETWDIVKVNWHNQPITVWAFIHTTCVYYSVLTRLLAHLDPFKTDCQSMHFLCHKSILKQQPNMFLLHVFPLCWVQPLSCWTDLSFHLFLHLLCFFVSDPLSVFDPEMFCGTLTPPAPLPSDSLTVPSPSSACVRSSMSEYLRHQQQHLVSRLECLLTTPPLLPSLLTHPPLSPPSN